MPAAVKIGLLFEKMKHELLFEIFLSFCLDEKIRIPPELHNI
jgi:hypothetical protein